MLCNRIKQFREYNGLEKQVVADFLGVDIDRYETFESGDETPTYDLIESLAIMYKVTVDELYGYTPRLALHTKHFEENVDDDVDERLLKMSDLSWDESQLVLYYRNSRDKEKVIRMVIDDAFSQDED